MIPPLFEHQTTDINFYLDRPYVFNTSDPGTGKTRTTIETIRRSAAHRPAIIFAPKSIMQASWGNDLDKFAPELTWIIATPANRIEAIKLDVDVVITNTDAAVPIAEFDTKSLRRFKYIVMDESTAYKNPTSQRSKAIAKLSEGTPNRTALTGTPRPNTILDLWHQAYLLDRGTRLGARYYAFRAAVCEPIATHAGGKTFNNWFEKPGIETVVAQQLSDITIRRTLAECTDIPPQHNYTLYYQPNKKTLNAYYAMKRDSMLEFDSGRITTAVHAAAVTNKMLQILSGAVYDNQGDYDLIDPERYELVMELAAQRQHSLIAFTWRHQKTELTRLATKLGLDFACIDGSTPLSQRAQIVNDYQAGRYQTLLAQPQSAGHGLTLTKGASIIWASPTYNLEHYLQFNRRVYRIGQTQKTEIINTCAKGTYEETAYTMLQGKKESQNIFLDFLSPILEPA